MSLRRGDSVLSNLRPEWGLGLIKDIRSQVADVHFQEGGDRRVQVATLHLAEGATAGVMGSVVTHPDPEYVRQLRELVAGFLSVANRGGIDKIEPKIYEAFLGSGTAKAEVKRQLRRWVDTSPFGRHEAAQPAAVSLWNFLFPEEPLPPGRRG